MWRTRLSRPLLPLFRAVVNIRRRGLLQGTLGGLPFVATFPVNRSVLLCSVRRWSARSPSPSVAVKPITVAAPYRSESRSAWSPVPALCVCSISLHSNVLSENRVFEPKELEFLILISDKAYTRNEVLDMIIYEKLMLNTLHFNMSVPTAYVFIRRFLKAAQADRKKTGSGKLIGVHRKYCSSKHNYTAKCEAASFLLDNSLL
ncbi:hypothetical protein Ahy_B04g069235 [Arachis hypogaea]|uniref:B-like cyclin n=1 Tax=Arachis hypogaea TaxID=3818 RepID=A0A444ZC16_ARAHY|nr:hypothetical protein Ahy_B04g069235 [Arachis hypogaea]